MKEKWQQLNKREQTLTAAMAVFVLIFLAYNLVWQPINSGIEKTSKKLASQQELLGWVKEKTALIAANSNNQTATKSSGSLSSIINRTARRHNILITRIQPQGDDIQVWIDQVVFSRFLNWLDQLAIAEGLSVKSIDLSNTDEAGIVKVRRLQLGKN
ncbi:type II secretion system protein GspM [Thalassotalea sp. PLHSN55]|uniref:type II secretion system protein GspM n=1 Tax=Thalassotalea sp. PLHSN55 TaxID=3435888 RepID=UPI003F82C5C1